MRLPYFQSSSPQYQARCLQSSTDMVNTARNKCQNNNNFASTYKRHLTTTVLNFTTWLKVCIIEWCCFNCGTYTMPYKMGQWSWTNIKRLKGTSSGQLQGTYPGICLERLTKNMKTVVKIRNTVRFNLLSFWMQVLVPCTVIQLLSNQHLTLWSVTRWCSPS